MQYLRPIDEAEPPEALILSDGGSIPNSRLSVVVYRGILGQSGPLAPADVQALFSANDWPDGWVNGIFGHHHYHSTAHEVLGVCRGWAEVLLGGPDGTTVRFQAGDVAVLPAGTGHKNCGHDDGFQVVGAYPVGQHPDICKGHPGERPASDRAIETVPLPTADPVYGAAGPLLALWRQA